MRHPSFAGVVSLGVAGLLGLGCGRAATRQDCETIVDRNVEVKLKSFGVTDETAIAKRRDEMRGAMKDDIDKCVGKRISDSMMTCVRAAQNESEIDKCIR